MNGLSMDSRMAGRVQGGSGPYTGSCSWSGIDGEFPPDKVKPLPHAYQSEARCSLRFLNVESAAIITNDEGQIPGGCSDLNVNLAGAAVPGDIVERLLNNPEEGECDFVVQFCRNAATSARNLEGVLVGEFPTEFYDCNRQPKLFQFGRMKLVG